MKKYCIVVISTGLIISVIQSDSYYDGLELNGQLFKELPETETTDDLTIIKTWHLRANGTFGLHLEKPSPFHVWDLVSESWKKPDNYLELIRNPGLQETNQLAFQNIVSKYPIHYQLNAPYDFGQNSPEVQTMRTYIDNIRNLAKITKTNIETSTTLEQINSIVDNFKTELGNIV